MEHADGRRQHALYFVSYRDTVLRVSSGQLCHNLLLFSSLWIHIQSDLITKKRSKRKKTFGFQGRVGWGRDGLGRLGPAGANHEVQWIKDKVPL